MHTSGYGALADPLEGWIAGASLIQGQSLEPDPELSPPPARS